MADDLGYGEVGVFAKEYSTGKARGQIYTPNLDRFASEGMRFIHSCEPRPASPHERCHLCTFIC